MPDTVFVSASQIRALFLSRDPNAYPQCETCEKPVDAVRSTDLPLSNEVALVFECHGQTQGARVDKMSLIA